MLAGVGEAGAPTSTPARAGTQFCFLNLAS